MSHLPLPVATQPRTCLALLALLALWPIALSAADWGGITPGKSTQEDVRRLFGPPTQARTRTEDSHQTQEWTYEGAQAPPGLIKLEVKFGLLAPEGFKPTVVRALVLYPKENLFPLATIQTGWGRPSRQGTHQESGRPVIEYDEGLVIFLDKEGRWAEEMYFVIPQRPPAAQ